MLSRAPINEPPRRDAPVAPEIFREACAQLASGVSIATVRDTAGTAHGMTISTFTPVSLDPPLVLICVDSRCALLPHFRASSSFAVNLLAESQADLSIAFSVKPEHRFEGVEWSEGITGAPLITGSIASLECRRTAMQESGDHWVIFGEVVNTRTAPGRPLVYFERGYRFLK